MYGNKMTIGFTYSNSIVTNLNVYLSIQCPFIELNIIFKSFYHLHTFFFKYIFFSNLIFNYKELIESLIKGKRN